MSPIVMMPIKVFNLVWNGATPKKADRRSSTKGIVGGLSPKGMNACLIPVEVVKMIFKIEFPS